MLFLIVVPLYETEPSPVALIDNVTFLGPVVSSIISLKFLVQPEDWYLLMVPWGTCNMALDEILENTDSTI